MTKRIFILNGHPAPTSLSRSFAESYETAASGLGHQTRVKHLCEMDFDADYGTNGYADPKPLEPILEDALTDLEWCEHFVLCTPMWWGGLPGKLKGFFDRTLKPGRAFGTRETTKMGLPKPLLTGRSARVILTADTPGFFCVLPMATRSRGRFQGRSSGLSE
ncbi:MAG: NAD(P)H-dependent oxidoreductase [Pseudomonadota bacterium]